METACEYLDDKVMRVSTDERKMITHLLKLVEKYPDEAQIIEKPETNDGCLYMKCPASWLLIRHPKKVNLSEEQKKKSAQRLAEARARRQA